MSKRVIYVDLSPEGIDYAIKELEKFWAEFKAACDTLVKQLTTLGVETAQSVLEYTTDGWTGQLEESIYTESGWDENNRIGRVRTSVPYAAYVEFGTGIAGQFDSHPDAGTVGWVYDINGRGEAGWWYYNPNDDEWHWTIGEPAKPFMYTAYTRIRDNAGRYTATVFANF